MKLSIIVRDDESGREIRWDGRAAVVSVYNTTAVLSMIRDTVLRHETFHEHRPFTGPTNAREAATAAFFGSPAKNDQTKLGYIVGRFAFHLFQLARRNNSDFQPIDPAEPFGAEQGEIK